MAERRGFWLGLGAVLAGIVGWLLVVFGLRRPPPPPPPAVGPGIPGDVYIAAAGGD
jgi:hypothetical protein